MPTKKSNDESIAREVAHRRSPGERSVIEFDANAKVTVEPVWVAIHPDGHRVIELKRLKSRRLMDCIYGRKNVKSGTVTITANVLSKRRRKESRDAE